MSTNVIPAEEVRFNTSAVQVYSGWGGIRTLRYVGKCPITGIRLYAHDDGQDDPRGILGKHAAEEIAPADFGLPASYPAFRVCWEYMNDTEVKYHNALRTIGNRWARLAKKHGNESDFLTFAEFANKEGAEYVNAVNGRY